MIVEAPAVVVPAAVCARIERALLDAESRARRDGWQVDPEAARVIAEVRALAAWHRASAASAAPGPATETRSQSTMMDVDEAAGMLGVTGHRVRQRLRAGTLAGRRVGGRWLVDRAVVERMTA